VEKTKVNRLLLLMRGVFKKTKSNEALTIGVDTGFVANALCSMSG